MKLVEVAVGGVCITVAACIIGGAATLVHWDNERRAQNREEFQRVYEYRTAWLKAHCARVAYDHGSPMYACEDGQVYEWQDVPTGEKP